jgi:hypothetical protein
MNTPTPEDIALADSIVRIIAKRRENGHSMFEMDISCRHADLPAAHYTALLIAAHCAPLRELAEIGRLAVEARRLTVCADADFVEWCKSRTRKDVACDAYLAKEPKP